MKVLQVNLKEKYFIIGNKFYKHRVNCNQSFYFIFKIHENDKWFNDDVKSELIKSYLDAKEFFIEKGII